MTNSKTTPTGFTEKNLCPRLKVCDKVLNQLVWNAVTLMAFVWYISICSHIPCLFCLQDSS